MRLLCHSLTWLSFIMQFVVLYLEAGESKGTNTASNERMTALSKGNLLPCLSAALASSGSSVLSTTSVSLSFKQFNRPEASPPPFCLGGQIVRASNSASAIMNERSARAIRFEPVPKWVVPV